MTFYGFHRLHQTVKMMNDTVERVQRFGEKTATTAAQVFM